MTVEQLKDFLAENEYNDTVIFENPDYAEACIGMTPDDRVVYSFDKMVEWLMVSEGLTMEEAIEHLDFNTIGSLRQSGGAMINIQW